MNFEEYRKQSAATAVYPGTPGSWVSLSYVALGAVGELGEVANQIKKVVRDDGGRLTPERRAKLVSEIGDGFWYLCRLLDELDIDEQEVFEYNASKLAQRQADGTLSGDGEHRKPMAFAALASDDTEEIDWKSGPGTIVHALGFSAAVRAASEAERAAAFRQEMAGNRTRSDEAYYRVTLTSVSLGRFKDRKLTRGFWALNKDDAARKAIGKFGGTIKEVVGPVDLTTGNTEGDRS